MLFKLAWRNVWRNKKRSIITIVSVFIAVFLSIFMRSMQLGMYDNMINNVVGSYSGYVQVHTKGYWEQQTLDNSIENTSEITTLIKNQKGVKNLIQRLQTFSLAASGDLTKGVLIQGIVIEKENLLTDWSIRLKEGTLFSSNPQEIILAKGVAKYFKVGVGDTLVFIGQGYHGMSAVGKYPICGIVDMKNPQINNLMVFMPLKTAQDYLGGESIITHLIIDKSENTAIGYLTKNLKSELDTSKYEIMDWKEMMPELQQTILADSIGGIIMICILYMIITFGIFGTVLMMTQERIYELGVMVAVGMKKQKLAFVLFLETVFLSLSGISIGILGILPITYYFNANPISLGGDQAETMEKFGFESVIPLLTDFSIPLTHGLIILSISLVISIYPIVTVLKLNPVKAMKS